MKGRLHLPGPRTLVPPQPGHPLQPALLDVGVGDGAQLLGIAVDYAGRLPDEACGCGRVKWSWCGWLAGKEVEIVEC